MDENSHDPFDPSKFPQPSDEQRERNRLAVQRIEKGLASAPKDLPPPKPAEADAIVGERNGFFPDLPVFRRRLVELLSRSLSPEKREEAATDFLGKEVWAWLSEQLGPAGLWKFDVMDQEQRDDYLIGLLEDYRSEIRRRHAFGGFNSMPQTAFPVPPKLAKAVQDFAEGGPNHGMDGVLKDAVGPAYMSFISPLFTGRGVEHLAELKGRLKTDCLRLINTEYLAAFRANPQNPVSKTQLNFEDPNAVTIDKEVDWSIPENLKKKNIPTGPETRPDSHPYPHPDNLCDAIEQMILDEYTEAEASERMGAWGYRFLRYCGTWAEWLRKDQPGDAFSWASKVWYDMDRDVKSAQNERVARLENQEEYSEGPLPISADELAQRLRSELRLPPNLQFNAAHILAQIKTRRQFRESLAATKNALDIGRSNPDGLQRPKAIVYLMACLAKRIERG